MGFDLDTDNVRQLSVDRKRPDLPAEPARGHQPISHRCAAYGCSLAGSIGDNSHAYEWWCRYHYSAPPDKLQAITQALRQHRPLIETISTARRLFAKFPMSNHSDSWLAAKAQLSQAGYEVPPARVVGVDDYRSWTYRVERLLGEKVRTV
jgi:hypothetical protein